jgi:hypothetical protein
MESNLSFAEPVGVRSEPAAGRNEAHSSGVSWGAVIGGAFVSAAFYLILLALGAGFGLSAVSPWSNTGVSMATVDTVAILWLVVIEIIASGLGGYLTGRLRTRWVLVHTDEVYFRDTANGFLSWAVSLVLSVTLLASAGAYMVGAVARTASSGEAGSAGSLTDSYLADTLFRTADRPGSVTVPPEASRILVHAIRENELSATDHTYLANLVANRTGISPSEAETPSLTFSAARARPRIRHERLPPGCCYGCFWLS